MNWNTILNPFAKFSERQLFISGLLFFALNGLVCFFTKTQMDSIFHFSHNSNLTVVYAYTYAAVSCASAIIFLFLIALLINKKTRFIDIVTTVLISQAPNFIILLLTKYSGLEELSNSLLTKPQPNIDEFGTFTLLKLLVFVMVMLVFIVYSFFLIFNGFKTATNFKKWQHIVLFVVFLFLFILFHQIVMQQISF